MSEEQFDWEDFDDEFVCPVCQKPAILPAGPKDSPILLVSGEPTTTEVGEGIPFVGQFAGVLRSELGLVGLDLRSMRRMTMWQHLPSKVRGKENPNKKCLDYGIQQVVKEAKNRKIVVLFGSDTVKALCGLNVSEVSGLVMPSPLMPSSTILPCVSVGSVFGSGVGEIRFAMRKLHKLAEEMEILSSKSSKKSAKSSRPEPLDGEIEEW